MNYPDGMTERDFQAMEAPYRDFPETERRWAEIEDLGSELTDEELDQFIGDDIEYDVHDALRDAIEDGRKNHSTSREVFWDAARLVSMFPGGWYPADLRRAISFLERMSAGKNDKPEVLSTIGKIVYERFQEEEDAQRFSRDYGDDE